MGYRLICKILKTRNPKSPFLLSPKTLREREGDSTICNSGDGGFRVNDASVSQAPSICTGGASSSHHKKFENSLSTEEEDLVPAMEDDVDGEEEKSSSFCRLLVIKMKEKEV
ncbi:hypothetical protein F2Q70_00004748 [Brassica cretica]|uniref:Uncharacterized protein n=1 Tax=Brassica cretica TaxID=69181 RepID=A0A8S9ILI1_BRACR|nr:hypothetical protein F2Q70_00004748 [Brassica cretica]